MSGQRAVSLADVARRAGVSLSTASKAINNRFDVGAATRDRVLAAAAELEFFPNALARSLMAGRSHTVGILTNDTSGRFVPSIMTGAQRALEEVGGVGVLLMDSGGEPDEEERAIRLLLERRVDGLIFVDDVMRPRPPVAFTGGTPNIYAFAASSAPVDTSIVPDLRQGARLGAEHLISLGRTSIVHIGGPAEEPSGQDRADGTRDALRAAGLPAEESRFLHGHWLEQWGWDGIGRVMQTGLHIDGVVAGNDQIARGVLDRLASDDVAVPDEIAVVGNDNWEVLTRFGRLPITSVDLQLDEIGAMAVRTLYQGARGRGTVHVPGRLVTRASTVLEAGPGPDGPIQHQ